MVNGSLRIINQAPGVQGYAKVCCFLRKRQLTLPITAVVVVTGLVW